MKSEYRILWRFTFGRAEFRETRDWSNYFREKGFAIDFTATGNLGRSKTPRDETPVPWFIQKKVFGIKLIFHSHWNSCWLARRRDQRSPAWTWTSRDHVTGQCIPGRFVCIFRNYSPGETFRKGDGSFDIALRRDFSLLRSVEYKVTILYISRRKGEETWDIFHVGDWKITSRPSRGR